MNTFKKCNFKIIYESLSRIDKKNRVSIIMILIKKLLNKFIVNQILES
jgi:hypothetical protein